MAGARQRGDNPRAQSSNPRAQGRRKARLEGEARLVVDGKVIGRVVGLELELDELKLEEQTELATGVATSYDPVREVWDHYVRVMRPRTTTLDPQVRAMIREALKVGTVSEWKRGIDGCAASDFHMGRNERGKKYNRPSHIFKGKRGGRSTREQLDMFLDVLEEQERGGAQSGLSSASAARISRAKRDVLDAAEFPGDERVVARARESMEWLRQQGIRVEYDGATPRFCDGAAETAA
jgi:hypothetical protein